MYPDGGGQFQDRENLIETEGKTLELRDTSTAHMIRNFLDCIKSREKCLCDLEEGHRSTTFAHLANISLEMGARIEWDPVQERITNNKNANTLLHYEYRKSRRLG